MRVKILFACLIITIFAASTCMAQKTEFPRNDVRLSYGMMTMGEMSLGLNELIFGAFFAAPFSNDSILNISTNGYGSFSFQYQYRPSKVVSIGAVFSFNPGTSSIRFNKNTSLQMTNYFVSFMPRADFYYLNRGIFSMYSGIAVGVTYAVLKENYSDKPDDVTSGVTLGLQANFVGFRVGKDIGGFVEFGFGTLGLINFGLSAKL